MVVESIGERSECVMEDLRVVRVLKVVVVGFRVLRKKGNLVGFREMGFLKIERDEQVVKVAMVSVCAFGTFSTHR